MAGEMRIERGGKVLPHGVRARAATVRALILQLHARRQEIGAAILARIQSDGGPTEAPDPEYAEGLRAAIPIAVAYCLDGIERGEVNPPPIPTALLSQARIAARNRISLDTVLRRYFAGYTLLGDFIIEEVEDAGLLRGEDLKRLLRLLAASFERLIGAVSEEHGRELTTCALGSEQRRAAQIERLIKGESLDPGEISYDLEVHHVGAIAKGGGAEEAFRDLAKVLDRRLLLVRRGEEAVWAWFGGATPLLSEDLERHLSASWPRDVRLAIGEGAQGRTGWRLTHRQARAALPIALRGGDPIVRYRDVALVASMLKDDLLATSLRESYLVPLRAKRERAETLLGTLRAYFATDRNVSSAAVALDIDRGTVASRLRTIEQRLGRSIRSCAAELELALRLEEIEAPVRPCEPASR